MYNHHDHVKRNIVEIISQTPDFPRVIPRKLSFGVTYIKKSDYAQTYMTFFCVNHTILRFCEMC